MEIAHKKSPRPVVLCPYLRSSEASLFQRTNSPQLTTQDFALTPIEKTSEVLPNLFPLRVVVRFRAVLTEHITLRP